MSLSRVDMSTYDIGAFDALEWVWHLLKEEDVKEASKSVQKALSIMGSGAKIDFKDKITEPKRHQ